MAGLDDEHDQASIDYLVNDPIIAYSKTKQFRPR